MVELGGCSFSSDEGSLDFIGTQKTFTEEVLSVSPIDPPDNSIIVVESTSVRCKLFILFVVQVN